MWEYAFIICQTIQLGKLIKTNTGFIIGSDFEDG